MSEKSPAVYSRRGRESDTNSGDLCTAHDKSQEGVSKLERSKI